jgi:hypothetical protein
MQRTAIQPAFYVLTVCHPPGAMRRRRPRLGLSELARLLVRLDHVVRFIVNANHRIM